MGAVPSLDFFPQSAHALRLLACQVVFLERIGCQVVEPIFFRAGRDLQLPVALAHGQVVAGAPKQRVMGPTCGCFVNEGQQIDAVDDAVAGQLGARCCGGSCKNIVVADWVLEHAAFGQTGRPPHEKWHMDAAFKKSCFPAPVRAVQALNANIVGTTVVTGEDDQGVVLKPLVFQGLQQPADVAVQRANHGGIDPGGVVLDVGQCVVVVFGGLQRRVRRVVAQV